jgi:hypothetical protein
MIQPANKRQRYDVVNRLRVRKVRRILMQRQIGTVL